MNSRDSKTENGSLILTRLRFSYFQILEFFKALTLYTNTQFAKADLSLRLMYLFNNPFSISKRFLEQRKNQDIYAYGETPLKTLELILSKVKITKEDHFFDLGSGRGRAAFFINAFTDAKVTAIEYIPEFVDRAKRIQQKLNIQKLSFINEDLMDSDLSSGTIFYLYGSSYPDDFLKKLAEKLAHLKAGIRVISVSFPITEYLKDKNLFEVINCFPTEFPWGESTVYVAIKKK